MTDHLLRTKQTVPPTRPNLVSRTRLLRQLNEETVFESKLTLISAPAGSGKTTLLSQFVDGAQLPLAWLSLDATDNDPVRFWTYLLNACRSVLGGIGETGLALLQASASPPPETMPTLLINDLAQQDQALLLVLDDYHVIENPVIHESLIFLLDYMPQNCHLIVATRSDPPWPLARYRARGQLKEIRAADLRFNRDETAEFFSQTMDLQIPSEGIAALQTRTEGWAAGLQLAAISLRGREDVPAFVNAFSGSHLYVAEYLLEEVLRRQPAAQQSFLLQTSILGRLTGDLCDALTGCQDGQDQLRALHQANLFTIPLDMDGIWFRYHHLFADLLQARLAQTFSPDQVAGLHLLAADWYEQNGMFEEAVSHLSAAGALAKMADLVEREGRKMMFSGQTNTLRGWLDTLPEAAFDDHPRLQIFRLWIDLLQEKGDISPRSLREKENSLRSLPASAENERLQVELIAVLCRFVAFSGDTAHAIRLAHEALASLPENEMALRARAYSALAVAHWFDGHDREAREAYEQTMSLALASGNYSLAAHASLMMGLSLVDYGRLDEAASLYQAVIDLGEEAGLDPFVPGGLGYIGLAGIYLEWNQLGTAENYLQQGMALARLGGYGLSAGHTIKARLRQAQADWGAAAAELKALGITGVDPTGMARAVQLHVARGDWHEASRQAGPWIRLLESGGSGPQPPLLVLEIMRLTVARLFLAQGDLHKAEHLLQSVQETAGPQQRMGRLIEGFLLKALLELQRNQGQVTDQAMDTFLRALELAQPAGYVLTFVEEASSVSPLLRAVIAGQEITPAQLAYARRLLEACQAAHSPPPAGQAVDLPEPLTPREMEVLQLAANGATNKEIAQELVITVRTVKKHMTNILGKLEVANRTQAAARALELGLIRTPQ